MHSHPLYGVPQSFYALFNRVHVTCLFDTLLLFPIRTGTFISIMAAMYGTVLLGSTFGIYLLYLYGEARGRCQRGATRA